MLFKVARGGGSVNSLATVVATSRELALLTKATCKELSYSEIITVLLLRYGTLLRAVTYHTLYF